MRSNIGKNLVWLTRECGTYMFEENDVLTNHAAAYPLCYFQYMESEHAETYFIKNIKYDDKKKLTADFYMVNYQKMCDGLRKLYPNMMN